MQRQLGRFCKKVPNSVATAVSTGRSGCGWVRQGRQGRWLAGRRRKKGAAPSSEPKKFGTSHYLERYGGRAKSGVAG
jgi:hypothetical protein